MARTDLKRTFDLVELQRSYDGGAWLKDEKEAA